MQTKLAQLNNNTAVQTNRENIKSSMNCAKKQIVGDARSAIVRYRNGNNNIPVRTKMVQQGNSTAMQSRVAWNDNIIAVQANKNRENVKAPMYCTVHVRMAQASIHDIDMQSWE